MPIGTSQLRLALDVSENKSARVSRSNPFVKWAGGKRKLLNDLLAIAPTDFERYIEPFVGGGALALAIEHSPMLLNDANPELINAYLAVRDHLEELMTMLDAHQSAHSETYYYAVRGLSSESLGVVEQAARLIYLNKTCFNGLYRVNRQGIFNVPSGGYVVPALYDKSNLHSVSRTLQHAELSTGDYYAFLDRHARSGDFIYLDPPYIPVSRHSDFKRYTKEQFRAADQIALADLYDDLVRRGAYPILSNSYCDTTLTLYAKHTIKVVHMGRNISNQGQGRGRIPEVLVIPKT